MQVDVLGGCLKLSALLFNPSILAVSEFKPGEEFPWSLTFEVSMIGEVKNQILFFL